VSNNLGSSVHTINAVSAVGLVSPPFARGRPAWTSSQAELAAAATGRQVDSQTMLLAEPQLTPSSDPCDCRLPTCSTRLSPLACRPRPSSTLSSPSFRSSSASRWRARSQPFSSASCSSQPFCSVSGQQAGRNTVETRMLAGRSSEKQMWTRTTPKRKMTAAGARRRVGEAPKALRTDFCSEARKSAERPLFFLPTATASPSHERPPSRTLPSTGRT
jgi:hypothetical protein